jgi:prepilin-type N-terminal cleavage/methylation domain-containing protein
MIPIHKIQVSAFTLIELLIVVAIISILTAGVGNVFFNVFQSQADINEQLAINQSADLAIESIAIDAAEASSVLINDNSIIFIKQNPGKPLMKIRYTLEGRNLIRLTENTVKKNRQLLAPGIREFSWNREKNLLHVKIIIEIKKYRKIFRKKYETTFRAREFM